MGSLSLLRDQCRLVLYGRSKDEQQSGIHVAPGSLQWPVVCAAVGHFTMNTGAIHIGVQI